MALTAPDLGNASVGNTTHSTPSSFVTLSEGNRMKTHNVFLLYFLSLGILSTKTPSLKSINTLQTSQIHQSAQESDIQTQKAQQIISENQVKKYNLISSTDLGKIIPSLSIYPQGSDTFAMISFRGMSSPDFYSSILGVYVDGIPQNPNFLIQSLNDIQSISLISGAMGVFYGENAPLGLIDIQTKNPLIQNYVDSELKVSFLKELINFNLGREILSNKLFLKLNTQYIHDNGYIYHPITNKTLNYANSIRIGTTIYSQIKDHTLITLNYNYHYSFSRKDFFLTPSQVKNLKLTSPSLATWEDFTNGVQDKILNLSPYNKTQAHNVSLKLDTSFKKTELSLVAAFSNVNTLANEYPGIYVLENENKDGYFYNTTQALMQSTITKKFLRNTQILSGLYYKYLSLDNGMRGVDTAPLGYKGDWDAQEIIHTLAFFSAINWKKGRFSVQAGARYQLFHNEIISKSPPVEEILPYQSTKIFHAINPSLTLSYQIPLQRNNPLPNSYHELYIQLSRTTKPGGFAKFPFSDTDTQPYDSESIYTLEAGKSMHFKNTAIKLAFYGTLRDNTQSYVGVGYYKSIKNVGGVYAIGADLTLNSRWKILDMFLGLNVGKSQFLKGGENIGSITILGQRGDYNLSNITPKFSPNISMNLGMDIFFIKNTKQSLALQTLLNFQSSYFLDDFNHNPKLIQKPYGVLNIALRFNFLKKYEISIFVNNITNARIFLYAISDTNGYAYIANEPRNIGIKIKYSS